MIYPNKPLYLLSLLGYIYCLTYYTLTTKDNIFNTSLSFYSYYLIYSFTTSDATLLSNNAPNLSLSDFIHIPIFFSI